MTRSLSDRTRAGRIVSANRVAWLPAFLFVCAASSPMQAMQSAQPAAACATHKPLTLLQVTGLIAQKVADDRIVQRIQACQAGFSLDAASLDKLTAAHASDTVMDALNQVTAAQLTLPQAKTQVADLEKQADTAAQANRDKAAQVYRARIAFLEQSSYADPRPLAYLHYNADSLQLAIAVGQEEYWFDQVPAASAQAIKANLSKAKAMQPYAEDDQHTRTLALEAISLPGIPRKAVEEAQRKKTEAQAAEQIAKGKAAADRRDYDAAIAAYNSALALDPNSQPAKDGLASAQAKRQEIAAQAEKDRASGVWVDQQTQLMWTLHDNGGDVNWNNASAYCQGLRTAGFSDWRLPDQLELTGLFDPDSTRQTPPLAKSFLYLLNGQVTEAAVGTTWTYHIRGGIQLTNTNVWTHVKEDSSSNTKAVIIDFQDGKNYRGLIGSHRLRRALCVRPTGEPASPLETAQSKAGAEPVPEMLKPSQVPAATREVTKQARVLFDQKRYADALPFVQKSCSAGDPEGCAMLGGMYFFAWGLPEDRPRGELLADKACDAGDGEACDSMGDVFYWGMGTAKDYPRSVGLYTKSCEAGFALACGNLARSYLLGNGVAKNRQQARDLYEKSCSMGYTKGCEEAKKIN